MVKTFFAMVLYLVPASSQTITISGYVVDSASAERLVGAGVVLLGKARGTTTNTFGFFSLPGVSDTLIQLKVSYLGYRSRIVALKSSEVPDHSLEILLVPEPIQADEILVEAPSQVARLQSTSLGRTTLAVSQITSLPSVGGEADILKAVQLTSGVSVGQEGSNAFYVRGGGFDQNLILLDGVPVYNPNHLFGFFSVFNTDALKSIDLFKAGIPVEYSGRLSSVLSLTMKEGNREKFEAKGGMSLLTSRITLEGPLSAERSSSWMIAARRTYLDPVFSLLGGKGVNAYFYDFNAKLNYQLSLEDRLYVSAYFGKDDLDFSNGDVLDLGSFFLAWSNQAYNVRWNRLWTPSVFSNLALVFSSYQSRFENGPVQKNPAVRDVSVRLNVEWYLSDEHTFRSGTDLVSHHFVATSGFRSYEAADEAVLGANEAHAYISDDWSISNSLKVTFGFSTGYFSRGNYFELDPRINMRLIPSEDVSLKFSYTKMHQFVHSLSAGVFATPGDVYYPSTSFLKPQRSEQISLGLVSSLAYVGLPEIEFTAEAYYKDLKNLSLFRQKFSSAQEDRLEQDLVFGRGWAYGVDIDLVRPRGRLNGWINYSLLISWRQFDEKNGGRPFHPKFDRTHQLNIVMNYQVGETWKAGATFVLASGQPITLPRQTYFVDGQFGQWYSSSPPAIDYGDIYSQRLPLYNRLDVGFAKSWQGWGGTWELSMSVYNVYGYPNALYVTYDAGGSFKQYSAGFIPSVGLNFKF